MEEVDFHFIDDDIVANTRRLQHIIEHLMTDGDNQLLQQIPVNLRDLEVEQEPPHWPVGEFLFAECKICFDSGPYYLRNCCNMSVCTSCMREYVNMQVKQGMVNLECPNDSCSRYVHRDEILSHLRPELKGKFYKFLVDANREPHIKTCPRCSHITKVDPAELAERRVKKYGLEVVCDECELVWCFMCQAPAHSGNTCKDFRRGDRLLKLWAKRYHNGQTNAQNCPKCKVYIQRSMGCDHMLCSKCRTEFCYRCGERYFKLRFVGDHNSKLSIFGCKYRFKPDKPVQRRLIRGALFSGKLVVTPVIAAALVVTGIGLLGASVFIIPSYCGYRLYKRNQQKKRIKRQRKARDDMHRRIQELRSMAGEEMPYKVTQVRKMDAIEELAAERYSLDSVYDGDLEFSDSSSCTSTSMERDIDPEVTRVKVMIEKVDDVLVVTEVDVDKSEKRRSTLEKIRSTDFDPEMLGNTRTALAERERYLDDVFMMLDHLNDESSFSDYGTLPYIDDGHDYSSDEIETPEGATCKRKSKVCDKACVDRWSKQSRTDENLSGLEPCSVGASQSSSTSKSNKNRRKKVCETKEYVNQKSEVTHL